MKIESFYNIFTDSNGVSIDSRTISKNQIFFAIKGERFDGHDYIGELKSKGVRHIVIDNKDYYEEGLTVLVDDSLNYLQKLAEHHRRQFDVPVLAITGSNGKTTTKELLTAVLGTKYNVHATKGNFNNHIGVPLTLLAATNEHDFLIIEMGANHVGEIYPLCQIAHPTHGLITNIGNAHIEGFGSIEGVIKGKTELFKYLRSHDGTVFFNGEDPVIAEQIRITDSAVTYHPSSLKVYSDSLTLSFQMPASSRYDTLLYGTYNLVNIAATLKIAEFFDVGEQAACKAIASYRPVMNRSQILDVGDTTFILDAYNANPSSMISSISSFQNIDTNRKKALILGDMKELGDDSHRFHKQIIELIDKHNWSFVALVGNDFGIADPEMHYTHYQDVGELIESSGLKKEVKDCLCLIKGSRSMQLEKIVNVF